MKWAVDDLSAPFSRAEDGYNQSGQCDIAIRVIVDMVFLVHSYATMTLQYNHYMQHEQKMLHSSGLEMRKRSNHSSKEVLQRVHVVWKDNENRAVSSIHHITAQHILCSLQDFSSLVLQTVVPMQMQKSQTILRLHTYKLPASLATCTNIWKSLYDCVIIPQSHWEGGSSYSR